jgi:predicted Mrr-cat superfamily restriction endonuclease
VIDLQALTHVLIERANLDPEQAERAAEVVLQFITEQAPRAVGLYEQAGGVEGIARQIGGLFGTRD